MRFVSPEEIDALLPQTQCGLCGYGGCMPYAEAIVFEQAAIHLCPPGGVETLRALGELLQQNSEPYMEEMKQKEKPKMLAKVREEECIGCTKCIKACPVDAILGNAKQMHIVITDECTGCELCIPPCPVDCIDMFVRSQKEPEVEKEKADIARKRFNARQIRLLKADNTKKTLTQQNSDLKRKDYIAAAIARVRDKKARNLTK